MIKDELFDYGAFFAPDSFDRATTDCCYTTASASPCLGEIAIDSATGWKPIIKGEVSILQPSSCEFVVNTSCDSAISAIDELRDRVCALENAAVQIKENVTRPLKNWRWKRADYKTLV